MRLKSGSFEAEVWEGGSPVWTQIKYHRGRWDTDTTEFHGLSIQDVRDLRHLLKGALRAVKAENKRMKNP